MAASLLERAAHEAAWGHVLARVPNAAGALVEVSYTAHAGRLVIECRGEGCDFYDSASTGGCVDDPPEKEDVLVDRALPTAEEEAQAHAVRCHAQRPG